ncbi:MULTISPECIES: methyl-accepting chemotaxis protein [Shewanella]|uniref:Methyl-accepting chemotaxis protein n=1 Tax=Shewanella psychromarinicola TaxID=2487742 RepID=A0A3N4DK08_9GAMM|nr:methyl-accepting chemotaxis protein [Shewanella psychromarinicola]AZG35769.1 methyl-accepting chemotaxis protein [Shewanella psychromarinicola]MCL1084180.1 methyl-accepting chemotaxis protein [Shewanella psychromarinicola]RPA22551.1 methyl-accepting chemotaxis protein [Shewanella psychromarinicola]
MLLKYKITGLFTSLSFFMVLLVSIVAYQNFAEFSQVSYQDKVETQSKLVAQALDEKLMRFFDVIDSAAFFFDENGELDLERANLTVEEIAKTISGEAGIYLGLKGGTLISDGEVVANFNAITAKREWFINIFAGERYVVSTSFVDVTKNVEVFGLSVPIMHQGEISGVVLINVPVKLFSDFVASLTSNNQMFVYRSDGYIVSSEVKDNIGKNIFELRPQYKVISDSNKSMTYTAPGLGDYFVTSHKMKVRNWTVASYESMKVIEAASFNNLYDTLILIIISLIVLMAVIYQMVIRLIYKPIGGEPLEISNMVKQVAEGDLSMNLSSSGQEDGIYGNVIAMAQNLRAIVANINNTTNDLNRSSASLSSSAETMSDGSKAQTVQLEQTSTAMNEMTSTVDEVARSALQAAESAQGASEYSEVGMKVVEDMNANIRLLVNEMNGVTHVIENVEAETVNIGSILDVIKGIADQTNLLALNAAIEAARAGEQGRGFAVVADEVRNLASRTQDSANEITMMIEKLQTEAKKAVDQMGKSTLLARQTSTKTEEANLSLTQITTSVSVILNMNDQIATASEQQTQVAAEINQSVLEINDSAKETNKHADSTTELANELGGMANTLNGIVSKFKL